MSNNKKSIGELIVMIIFTVIITIFMKSCSRSEANMVLIYDRYVYDAETNIIYIEMTTGGHYTQTTYTEYYTENGNLCRYNVETGEFEEIIP